MEIQGPTRLSHSLLWELQQRAYETFGPDAWVSKGVPSHTTSNPLIARQYTAMILGYLRDIYEKLDLKRPVYLFDLGAGTGKLAYLILKDLLPKTKELFPGVSFCYVMTDITEKNFDFWANHPYFQAFFEEGTLDYCYYRHSSEEPLNLVKSQKSLNETENPLILICNYFFDTIPQDLFRVEDGKIEEGKVALKSNTDSIDPKDPAIIPDLEYAFQYEPISQKFYYEEEELDQFLFEYQKLFENAAFVFPSEPIRTIQRFSRISGGRLLLLAGDQGKATWGQIKRWKQMKLAIHASFSLEVNYHALNSYFAHKNGVGLIDPLSDPYFMNFAGVFGEEAAVNTRIAFEEHLQAFSSADYCRLTQELGQNLDEILLQIKLGAFDPSLFYEAYGKISTFLQSATPDESERLVKTIDAVWEKFFPTCAEEADFIMDLGVLLFQLQEYKNAKKYFRRALQLGGEENRLNRYIRTCDYRNHLM